MLFADALTTTFWDLRQYYAFQNILIHRNYCRRALEHASVSSTYAAATSVHTYEPHIACAKVNLAKMFNEVFGIENHEFLSEWCFEMCVLQRPRSENEHGKTTKHRAQSPHAPARPLAVWWSWCSLFLSSVWTEIAARKDQSEEDTSKDRGDCLTVLRYKIVDWHVQDKIAGKPSSQPVVWIPVLNICIYIYIHLLINMKLYTHVWSCM
jgi:hypothetical protein